MDHVFPVRSEKGKASASVYVGLVLQTGKRNHGVLQVSLVCDLTFGAVCKSCLISSSS